MLVALTNVDKYYGTQTVLEGVNFALHPGERVALVGRNGAGKSTLLRLLSGEEEPLGGRVERARGVQVAMLRQDPVFDPEATIHDVLEAAFHELDALEEQLEALQLKLDRADEETLQAYHDLLEHYQLRGGFERRARRDGVTLAFGFRGREFERVGALSGGERTRLALAAILVANPEVLLLDEPTNHLDIAMREWLEGFLSRYPGAMIVVSHDRAFLDAVATQTAYLRDGQLKVYPGNYSFFRKALEVELEQQLALFETQQKQIDRLEKSAARMKIWGLGMAKLARRARSMETRLERMKAAQVDAPPPEEDVAEVRFEADDSGEVVLEARHLTKVFGGRQLFKDVSVTVRRGDRIAIVGLNGAGKTTFLRTLLGLLPSDSPRTEIRLGARVRVGYYDQQLRGVDPENTLYDEARALVESDQAARNLLGAFLFPYDAQTKRVKSLSGGERARLALLKLSLERNNLLILDEPTNHLDMEMLESLEEALSEYTGTLLMVSHDRTFIEHLATQIWLLEDGQFYSYPGSYSYYRQKHVPASSKTEAEKPRAERPRRGPSLWHLKRRHEALETEIAGLEERLALAQQALERAAPDADFARLGQEAADLEERLLAAMQEWDSVGAQIAEQER
ncbi:ATP-binding cassette subfamily F protein 3 [Deinobacterium chartae]|uniref:ATP-binding cassette subfamily F protein 3 n=1 Tax=Deinobacterium chartae TaxID=521158 RepID=A0A841HYX5_9DEIO|nr:ATP-binding cassette subfamily F protein 3 [Deinobacterium chartae]